MDALPLLVRFAENNAWSNLRLHRACARLTPADFQATRTSFFPSLPRTLNHILLVDLYYMDALEDGGRGLSFFDDEMPHLAIEPLAKAQREADMRLIALTKALTAESVERRARIPRADHVQVERVGDILMHLFVHQIHHRGQAHAMLAGTPVKPPQLDEFFLREELPLREAELRELGLTIA